MIRRLLLFILGLIFLFFSVIGGILPIIPGFLFLLLSVIMFSLTFPVLRKVIDKVLKKFPMINKYFLIIEKRIQKIINKKK